MRAVHANPPALHAMKISRTTLGHSTVGTISELVLSAPARRILEFIQKPCSVLDLVGIVRLSGLGSHLRELQRLHLIEIDHSGTEEQTAEQIYGTEIDNEGWENRAGKLPPTFPELELEVAEKTKAYADSFLRRVLGPESLMISGEIDDAATYEELLGALGMARRELFDLRGKAVADEFYHLVIVPLVTDSTSERVW